MLVSNCLAFVCFTLLNEFSPSQNQDDHTFFFFFKLYKIVLLFLYLGLVMLHKATENFI